MLRGARASYQAAPLMSEAQTPSSNEPAAPAPRGRDLWRVAWVVAPLALAMVGYAFFLAEGRDVDHEILLLAPAQVQLGDALPVRARVFEDIRFPESAALTTQPDLELSLVRAGHVIATQRLRRAAESYEGSFASDALGATPAELELRARLLESSTVLEGSTVLATCTRSVQLVRQAPAAPVGGRLVSSLALLDLGPITLLPSPAPQESAPALDP